MSQFVGHGVLDLVKKFGMVCILFTICNSQVHIHVNENPENFFAEEKSKFNNRTVKNLKLDCPVFYCEFPSPPN